LEAHLAPATGVQGFIWAKEAEGIHLDHRQYSRKPLDGLWKLEG